MKRLGAIICTFYIAVSIYIIIVKPMVLVVCVACLLVSLGLTYLVKDVLFRNFFNS